MAMLQAISEAPTPPSSNTSLLPTPNLKRRDSSGRLSHRADSTASDGDASAARRAARLCGNQPLKWDIPKYFISAVSSSQN